MKSGEKLFCKHPFLYAENVFVHTSLKWPLETNTSGNALMVTFSNSV